MKMTDKTDTSRLDGILFDLDGTLLGADLRLPDILIAAVGRLRQRGVTAVIVTGRMHRTAERYAMQLGLEGVPLVSFNGAMARCAGRDETWWYDPIDTSLAVEVITFLAERGLEPLVFDGDLLYTGEANPRVSAYSLISGVEPLYVENLLDRVSGTSGGGAIRPAKMLQVEDAGAMPALLKEAAAHFGESLNVTTSYPFFLEFMNRRACKGAALARLAERLGVDRAQVAAFGDGLNDLEMIRWAGLGVAMGHGCAPLREEADHVIYDPPGEGVARFLEDHMSMWTGPGKAGPEPSPRGGG